MWMSKPKFFPTPDPPSASLYDLQPLWSHQTPLDSPQSNSYPFFSPQNTGLTCSWSHKSTDEQWPNLKWEKGERWTCLGWGRCQQDLGTPLSPEEAKKWLQVPGRSPGQVPGMNFSQSNSLRIVWGCSQGTPCSPGNTKMPLGMPRGATVSKEAQT